MVEQIPLLEAEYDGFPVLFQPDGFINATQVAKHFGKRPGHWLELESAKEYIEALQDDLGAGNTGTQTQLVVTIKSGQGNGTWLHPELAVPFARWLSVKFAIWCDRQIHRILNSNQSLLANISKSERLLLDRIAANNRNLHTDHFPVFNECLPVLQALAAAGIELDHTTVPDGSIGQRWGKFWNSNPELATLHGPRRQFHDSPHKFPGTFPQAKGVDKLPWYYPLAALPIFRKWLTDEYIPKYLPTYLKRKEQQHKLPPGSATKFLDEKAS